MHLYLSYEFLDGFSGGFWFGLLAGAFFYWLVTRNQGPQQPTGGSPNAEPWLRRSPPTLLALDER